MMGKRGSVWGIRFNVFVSGAVVMALELVGSRILAPVFGDSIFVWGPSSGWSWPLCPWGTTWGGGWRTGVPATGSSA